MQEIKKKTLSIVKIPSEMYKLNVKLDLLLYLNKKNVSTAKVELRIAWNPNCFKIGAKFPKLSENADKLKWFIN